MFHGVPNTMSELTTAAIQRAQKNLLAALRAEQSNGPDSVAEFQALTKRARADLPAALAALAQDQRPHGAAAEFSVEMEKLQPLTSTNGIRVPMSRALTNAGNAGFLTGTKTLDAQPATQPTPIAIASGATVIMTNSPISVPRITSTTTTGTLGTETSTVPQSNPAVGTMALSAKNLGAYVEISRLLVKQSNAAEVIRNDIFRALTAKMDNEILNGSGVGGDLTGILSTSGVGSFSGTTLALPTLLNLQDSAGDTLDDSAAFATTRGVAKVLRARPEITGSTDTLWRGPLLRGLLTDIPARTSTAVNAGQLIFGSWSWLWIAIWGGGIELAVNPFGAGNFQNGVIGLRALITMDAGIVWPAAFSVSNSGVT